MGVLQRLFWYIFASNLSCFARNLRASPLFGTVFTSVVEFTVISPSGGLDGYQTISFHPTIASPPFPLSDRDDQTLDFDVMLPNVADDPTACSGPWNTTDEFGRNFSGAFLIVQGNCRGTSAASALASGAAGLIFTSCAAPLCNPLGLLRIALGSTSPTISITYDNGLLLLNYLMAARNSSLPPLTVRFISTGTIVESERAALISIMQKTVMGRYSSGSIAAPRENWNATKFNESDPCRDRPQGLWCERGHVVIVEVQNHEWRSSSLPTDFSELSELRFLSLSSNLFNGPVPPEWCALSNLRVLRLDSQIPPNAITGLPECIGAWSQLTEFQFTNQAIKHLPIGFSMLTSLRYVMGNGNGFTSLSSIADMNQLVTFDVSGNAINGSFPDINRSAPLTGFYIGGNNFFGTIPSNAFDGLATLVDLDVNSNQFQGPLPDLQGCTHLRQADFGSQSGEGFTGARPTMWAKLSQLFYLDLQENSICQFTASDLPSLDTLDLSFNQLGNSANGSATDVLEALLGTNLRSLSLSNNYLDGPLLFPSTVYTRPIFQFLYMDNNMLTSLDPNLFMADLVTADFSNNNLSTAVVPFPATTSPQSNFNRLDLRGNPAYRLSALPVWLGVAPVSEGRVQLDQDSFLCLPIKVTSNPSMTILVDPSFWNYENCICAAGSFGSPPTCLVIPTFAELNPDRVISSEFVESDFLSSLQAEEPFPTNNNDSVSRWISDEMYGTRRLTPGMNTKWVANLTDTRDEDGVTPRVITWFIYINTSLFTQISDTLAVYEGGPDEQGTRVLITTGASLLENQTVNLNISRHYIRSDGDDVSFPMERAVLLTVPVFSDLATLHFTSQKTAGLHFVARYEFRFDCPIGYYFDLPASQCRVQLPTFHVDPGVRAAVLAVASVAGCLQIVLIVIIRINKTNAVYRAGSIPHLYLTLIFLLAMSLGAMLYAAIPAEEANRDTASAVCVGRAWLTCFPLAGVVAVMVGKAFRIGSIFGDSKLVNKKQANLPLTLIILCSLLVQVMMCLIFALQPLSRAVLATGKTSLSQSLVAACTQEPGFRGWFGAEVAIFGVLLLPAAYYGFKTRDVPDRFNESAHIQNAIIVLLFFAVVICPLAFYITNDPTASVLVQGIGQGVLSLALTGIIFGPKVYHSLLNGSNTNSKHSNKSETKSKSGGTPITTKSEVPAFSTALSVTASVV
jgi:hypothetical protein